MASHPPPAAEQPHPPWLWTRSGSGLELPPCADQVISAGGDSCARRWTSAMCAVDGAAALSVRVAVSPGETVAGSMRASTPGGNSATDSESAFAAAAGRSAAVSSGTESVLPRPITSAPRRGQTAKSGDEAQPGSWKLKIRVRQLKTPSAGMYSFTYQKVHSSPGSTDMLL